MDPFGQGIVDDVIVQVAGQFYFARINEKYVVGLVALLVESVAAREVDRFQLMDHLRCEIVVSVAEEINGFKHLDVSLFDDLALKICWNHLQQFLRLLELFLDILVLEVPLNPAYETWAQVVALGVGLQEHQLLLVLLVVFVVVLDHLGHVAEGVRIEAYSGQHPDYAQKLFL